MWKKIGTNATAMLAPLFLLAIVLALGATWKIRPVNAPLNLGQGNSPSAQPDGNNQPPPKVDIFGNPLDDFARDVIDRQGIAGTVVMGGQPVPGALVTLRQVSNSVNVAVSDYADIAANSTNNDIFTVNTGANGKFAFYGLKMGHYGLEAYTSAACGTADMPVLRDSMPDKGPGKIEYIAKRAQVLIELQPSSSLSGRLLTTENKPVGGAILYPIQCNAGDAISMLAPVQTVMLNAKTGPDGSFTFPRLAKGSWQLAIKSQGNMDQVSEWLSTGDRAVEISMKKRKAGVENAVEEMDFVWIPAGSFSMGSPPDEKDRDASEKRHDVTLTQGFWLGKYEVSQVQWAKIMGYNPSMKVNDDCPVNRVSWDTCQEFIGRMNEKRNGHFRLPTEAEWEYACRAGSNTRFHWGDDPNNIDINKYAWSSENDHTGAKAVGQKFPNAWGIFDMSGNMSEWCQDWFGEYPDGSVTDPKGPNTGERRVARGGAWMYGSDRCRSADRRFGTTPNTSDEEFGLRLVWQESFDIPKTTSDDIPAPNPNGPMATVEDLTGTVWEISPTNYGPLQMHFKANGIAVASAMGVDITGIWTVDGHYVIASAEIMGKRESIQAEIVGNTLASKGITIKRLR